MYDQKSQGWRYLCKAVRELPSPAFTTSSRTALDICTWSSESRKFCCSSSLCCTSWCTYTTVSSLSEWTAFKARGLSGIDVEQPTTLPVLPSCLLPLLAYRDAPAWPETQGSLLRMAPVPARSIHWFNWKLSTRSKSDCG